MKKIISLLSLAVIFTLLVSMSVFETECVSIRDKVLRLHILANSDSEYDQKIKLEVRDQILKDSEEIFVDADDYDDAVAKASRSLDKIKASAQKVIDRHGCAQSVQVELGYSDFNTRHYDDVTLPAGRYMAVRVMLGQAKGQNWWCIMFPAMCIPSAGNRDSIDKTLDKGQTKIVSDYSDYKPAFKIVEWYERIKSSIK